MSAHPSFFAELKRRNVLRAALLYIGAVWALAQGLAQLLPVFSIADWVTRYFVAAAAIGFPFWLAFAWFYEFTPEGLKRESEVAPSASTARQAGRKLDLWIFAVLAVAVVLLLTDRFAPHGDPGIPDIPSIPEQSVAVLPLANESGDPGNDYFSDGLSEQLISDLSRVEALRVIGRSSSFRFRGSKESLAAIGAQLGVAHLIEGTVRQSGGRVRIVIGLIRAADGSSVWSQSYDGELKDVFAVQADVAQAVAAALRVKLAGAPHASGETPPSGNVEAYQALLQARAVNRQGTPAAYRQGIAYYEKALRLEPDYALAYAGLSTNWLGLGTMVGGAEQQQAYAEARRTADRALALAPELAAAHIARGNMLRILDFDQMGALAAYRRALALAPGDGTTMSSLASQLATVGELQQSIELQRKAIATDPLSADAYHNLANPLMAQGRLDEAEQAVQSALALQPGRYWSYLSFSTIAILRGDVAAALRYAEQEPDPQARELALAQARQIAGDRKAADAALQAYVARYGEEYPSDVASLYALRKEPDAMFAWLERARAEHDWNVISLLVDPFILAYRHDPRFAALCKKLGLPVPS